MELKNLSVTEFAAITASDAPAPGGGSVSALAGSIAAALGEMVARLTVGREKYASSQAEMEKIIEAFPPVREKLMNAVDEDSKAFDQYMAALAMPKTTDEEKSARSAAMQEGLKAAARVPLGVAQAINMLFPSLEKAVTIGNPNAVTDGMVGTMMARTGILGALFNVRVNLESIKDEAFVAELSAETDKLQQSAAEWERKILSQVKLSRI